MTKQKASGISWTEETWNPVRGCSRISKGCMNCYAERVANRFKGPGQPYEGLIASSGQWNGEVRLIMDKLMEPIRWRKPKLIFVNSMSDLFHESLTDDDIDRVFAVMAIASHHTFQVLTKRADRMYRYLSGEDLRDRWARASMYLGRLWLDPDSIYDGIAYDDSPYLPNVWLGVSVENQATADERIPLLIKTPAAVRWVSAEPMIGPIDLSKELVQFCLECSQVGREGDVCEFCGGTSHRERSPLSYLDWVVVGGESGIGARPMLPDWPRLLRDQCQAAGVPFHFKQWGEYHTGYVSSNGEAVFRQFTSFQHWVNKANTWVRQGICLDRFGNRLKDGGDFARARDTDAFPVTIMHKMGKKEAGRLLDGQLWDEYPKMKETDP